jgi:hypothetical protein
LKILQVTAGGVERMLGQLEDWLRSEGAAGGGDGDGGEGGTGQGPGGRSSTRGRRA